MADEFALLDGRARTLLQSFDTARFQRVEDGSQTVSQEDRERAEMNRHLDAAHARTEVLSALLMGYDIVLPAGVIADCPAFLDIFSEVIAARPNDLDAHAYRPFRIGLEARFKETDRWSGYDHFLTDFSENFSEELVQLNVASGLAYAGASVKNQTANVKALVALFKARKFTDLDKAQPRYGEHLERVFEELCEPSGAKPIMAAKNAFSAMPAQFYPSTFARLAERASGRVGVDEERIDRLALAARRLARRLPDPRQRGQWYRRKADFGDLWPEARAWLDYGLYDRMTEAFGVAVPSMFLQQTSDDPHTQAVALAFLDDLSFSRFQTETEGRRGTAPPVVSQVIWNDIWNLILEPDVRASATELQRTLSQAYFAERSSLFALATFRQRRRIDQQEFEARSAEVKRVRERDTVDQVARHVSLLSQGSTQLQFIASEAGILVQTTRESKVMENTAKKAAGIGARYGVLTALGWAAVAMTGSDASVIADCNTLMLLGSAGIQAYINDRTGDALSAFAVSGVEKLSRAAALRVFDAGRFELMRALEDQVNLWVRPRFTGM